MKLIHYLTFVATLEYWSVAKAESSSRTTEKVNTTPVARKSRKINFKVGRRHVYYKHESRRGLPLHDSNELTPSLGYEAYWAGGHWVFEDDESLKDVGMCGQECPPLYVEYGVICSMDMKNKQKTFKNYCEMRNSDCKHRKHLVIVHRGECLPIEHKTINKWLLEVVSNADHFVDKFMKSFPTTFGIYHGTTMEDKILFSP